MISKNALKFLIGLLAFSYSFAIQATVQLKYENQNVVVSTDQIGVSGYKGCNETQLQKVEAYVFNLFKKQKANPDNSCKNSKSHNWIQVGKIETDNPQARFKHMEEGEYKAIVYSGQSIGCLIKNNAEGFPPNSIIYHQEKTKNISLGNQEQHNIASTKIETTKGVLSAFPNPTSKELNVQLKNSDFQTNANLLLYDLLGQVIIQEKQTVGDAQFIEWTLDLNALADGAYIIKVFDDEGQSYEKKIVVNKNH